jgi:hypothetical protein
VLHPAGILPDTETCAAPDIRSAKLIPGPNQLTATIQPGIPETKSLQIGDLQAFPVGQSINWR